MRAVVRGNLPLLWSAALLLGSIAWTVRALHGVTNKEWLYPIDDAYIHLSLARTLVQHGVWGVDAAAPSTATSSPGWVLLLAVARLLPGLADIAPALLSVAGSLAICLFADRLLIAASRQAPRSPARWDASVPGSPARWDASVPRSPARWDASVPLAGLRALALSAVILLTPLAVLTVLGMEHTVFVAVVLAWVAAVERPSTGVRSPGPGIAAERHGGRVRDLLLAGAIVWLRPEGALVLVAWALTRFRNARVRWSVAAGAIAGAAMALLQWLVAGSPFSIATLVKTALVREAGTPLVAEIGRLVWLRVYSEPWILVLWLLIVALVAGSRGRSADPPPQWPIALVPLLPLHVICSEVGSGFGRYESYVLVLAILGVAALGPSLAASGPHSGSNEVRLATVAALGCAALVAWPLVARPGLLQDAMLRDARTLHGVHWQLARFVNVHGHHRPIVADDIGLLAYYGEAPVVDVVGQATPAVAYARQAGQYNVRVLEEAAAAAGATMAIVSKGWFEEPFGIPRWVHLADVTVAGSVDQYTLTIWAVAPETAPALRDALAAFAATLPAHTVVTWQRD